MKLTLNRFRYFKGTTLGKLYVDGKFFGYTLEDKVRRSGIKVMHETAIPATLLKVKLTYSNRFGRIMPLIFNQPDLSVQHKGIRFDGIRIHGGGTKEDTSGCVIVAKNLISKDQVQGSLEAELTKLLQEAGGEATIRIRNVGEWFWYPLAIAVTLASLIFYVVGRVRQSN